MKKLTSDKFLRFYAVASFVLTVMLSIVVLFLYNRQQTNFDNVGSQIDGLSQQVKDTRSAIDEVGTSAKSAESNAYEACREIKQSNFC